MTSRGITIVAGVSRSGKSTFALRYLVNADVAYRFIFDAQSGHESYAHRLNCDAAGTGYELGLQLCQGWVLFNPHEIFAGRLAQAFNFFCDWSWEMSKKLPGSKVLVIDEAWKYVTPQRYPEELAACVQSGAGYGLQCMFNTQTPNALHGAIQNECSELVCFKLGGSKALGYVAEKGLNPDEVQALPPLSYVARNIDSGGEIRGRIEI